MAISFPIRTLSLSPRDRFETKFQYISPCEAQSGVRVLILSCEVEKGRINRTEHVQLCYILPETAHFPISLVELFKISTRALRLVCGRIAFHAAGTRSHWYFQMVGLTRDGLYHPANEWLKGKCEFSQRPYKLWRNKQYIFSLDYIK